MTRAAAPPILLQLQSSESASSQVALLRTLKNELIGHDQRKETYVAAGIIPVLGQLLSTRRPGRVTGAESNGAALNQAPLYQNSDESEACLQAILIAGSLAQGTPILTPRNSDRRIDRKLIRPNRGTNIPCSHIRQRHPSNPSRRPIFSRLSSLVYSPDLAISEHHRRPTTTAKPGSMAPRHAAGGFGLFRRAHWFD